MKNQFPDIKEKDLETIDRSLKKHGNLGPAIGDFSQGLAHYLADHTVTIEDLGAKLSLTIVPRQGNWDFTVSVDKETGTLENPAVGTIEPSPTK